VKHSRRIETHFRSPQLQLWQTSETTWLLALRQPEQHKPQKRRTESVVVQLSFPEMDLPRGDQVL